MNQDVAAAVSLLNSPVDVSPLTGGHASPDALAQLGDALARFSSRVAQRERELNSLFEQIAVERTSLLDAVLARLVTGFSGVIPFDQVECTFLSDDRRNAISHWSRSLVGVASASGNIAALDGSALLALLATGRPRIINNLGEHLSTHASVELERRLYDEGARSALACPLVADGVPLGFLLFTSRQTQAFTEAHAEAFQRSAAQVSIVVHKTRAYGEVAQKTRAYGEVINHNRMLMRETRRLREVATTDALTGVMNRRALDAALASAWDRYERDRAGFGLVLCDVDRFKLVNDTYGHAVGDQVLAAVARCLGRGLRGADVVGRWGGEEFLAIVDTTAETTLAHVAERLRLLIAGETPGGIAVTASFGSAVCHRYATLGDLIVSADRALYRAKTDGRNRCIMATDTGRAAPQPGARAGIPATDVGAR